MSVTARNSRELVNFRVQNQIFKPLSDKKSNLDKTWKLNQTHKTQVTCAASAPIAEIFNTGQNGCMDKISRKYVSKRSGLKNHQKVYSLLSVKSLKYIRWSRSLEVDFYLLKKWSRPRGKWFPVIPLLIVKPNGVDVGRSCISKNKTNIKSHL